MKLKKVKPVPMTDVGRIDLPALAGDLYRLGHEHKHAAITEIDAEAHRQRAAEVIAKIG
jgi:hypothetical protein